MNIDFSLPGSVPEHWQSGFLGKIEYAKAHESNFENVTEELVLFLANNHKKLSEYAVIEFLENLEQSYGISKGKTLVSSQKLRVKIDEVENETKEVETPEKNRFTESIIKIKTLYPDIAVNSLTKEILSYNKATEKYEQVAHQTFFTRLNLADIKYSKSNVLDYLYSPIYTQSINPIQQIIESFPKWEPGDYDFMESFFKFVKIHSNIDERKVFFRIAFKKWAIKCIENALSETAIPNKQIIIFKGGQSSRKTSLIRALMRPFMPYVVEDIELKANEINTKKAITQNMFILNDEFDKISNKELKNFKIIMTSDRIKYKPQGTSFDQSFKRRANFMSSTNENRFLTDSTGNVRFVIIPIAHTYTNPIPAEFLNNTEFFAGLWGQAYYYYKKAFDAELTTDEMIIQEEINREFTLFKSIDNALISYFPPPADDAVEVKLLSASELLDEINKSELVPGKFKRNLSEVHLGKILNSLNYNRVSTKQGPNRKYRYEFSK